MATATQLVIKIINTNGTITIDSFAVQSWTYNPTVILTNVVRATQELMIGTKQANFTVTISYLTSTQPTVSTLTVTGLIALATAAVTNIFGAGALLAPTGLIKDDAGYTGYVFDDEGAYTAGIES